MLLFISSARHQLRADYISVLPQCLLLLCCCVPNYHKLAAENNTHYYLTDSVDQKSRCHLSGSLDLWSLTGLQPRFLGLGVSSECLTGEGFISEFLELLARISTLQVMGWGPRFLTIWASPQQLKIWQLASVKPTRTRMCLQGRTYNLMLYSNGNDIHHLCNILLARTESSGQLILNGIAQGHEFQDAEVFGDHLRLPPPLDKTERSKRQGPHAEP